MKKIAISLIGVLALMLAGCSTYQGDFFGFVMGEPAHASVELYTDSDTHRILGTVTNIIKSDDGSKIPGTLYLQGVVSTADGFWTGYATSSDFEKGKIFTGKWSGGFQSSDENEIFGSLYLESSGSFIKGLYSAKKNTH